MTDNTDNTDSTPVNVDAERLRQWHRLFGIALTETFEGHPWRVELEKELALRSQLLDIAIIETIAERATAESTTAESTPTERGLISKSSPDSADSVGSATDKDAGSSHEWRHELPDGLENLRPHNLLTYKSRHEALNAWALDELIAHFVNYRKLSLDSQGKRHPQDAFGLYAVATRFPKGLLSEHKAQCTEWEGVYDIPWGGQQVRLIVLNAIAKHPRNAPWELFASEQDRTQQGLIHYRTRGYSTNQRSYLALLGRLHLIYLQEQPDMAYSMEEFLRETHELVLAEMTVEERLRGLGPEERLRGLGPDEVLKRFRPEDVLKRFRPEERLSGLEPEERLRGLGPEERLRGLGPEDRLKGIDFDVIESWLAKAKRGEGARE